MNFIDLTKEEQLTILAEVAESKGIVDNAVEKDYWVSMVLRAIFSLSFANALIFKGGTSLSKGWSLIDRFSEDLDLAIDPGFLGFDSISTKKERTKLRKESKKFIDGVFALSLENKLDELGLSQSCNVIIPETSISDLDPVVLFVEYDSVLRKKMAYMPERVKIEISCRSLIEPSEDIRICSMIEEIYSTEEFSGSPFPVPTAIPGRTFLEKIFLLHEEFNRPDGCQHIDRITRHMYDIVKMMDQPFAIEVLQNEKLYRDIISHRQKFTAWSGLDYTSHLPGTISFLPPEHIDNILREDYRQMQLGFIYAEAPSFDEILEQLRNLQNRIRQLEWK